MDERERRTMEGERETVFGPFSDIPIKWNHLSSFHPKIRKGRGPLVLLWFLSNVIP
jgi:hypothetical protein